MSSLAQFGGGSRPPALLVQRNSAAGWAGVATVTSIDSAAGAKLILSGALTANTLATALSVTGSGSLQYLSILSVDATSRTLRLVLTIDGVVTYDFTSAAIAAANTGGVIVGSGLSTLSGSLEDMRFNSSLLVQVASSLSETDKVQIGVRYRTF
jgi:hypothetical protein